MAPDVFLPKAKAAAIQSQHIFPAYAACEAALESAWGSSELAIKANNLFGQKRGLTGDNFPFVTLPTHEIVHGVSVVTTAEWPVFPDWETSFYERMVLLKTFSIYSPALAATTGDEFVTLVSRYWATDPYRAAKVLAIYKFHEDLLNDNQ